MNDKSNNLWMGLLDTNCPTEVELYEQAFYRAFERASHNRLIRKLWNWNDEVRRLAVRLPYSQQINYVMRREDTGDIVTGLAVNCDCSQAQSHAYGFTAPESDNCTCEFLTLFSVSEYSMQSRFLFWRTVFNDLQKRGYKTAYGTTASKVLRFYTRMGAQVIDQRSIDGEERYFLRFDTSCTSWTAARRLLHDPINASPWNSATNSMFVQ